MKLLEKICEELGVEVGEIWQGSDGYRYCILSDGNLERYEGDILEEYMTLNVIWKDIISGELKPVWKPKEGETYFTISFFEGSLIELLEWGDRVWERGLLERGLVFKTEEEAITAANKMLEAIKEGK